MVELLLAALLALGVGFASALIPVINVEALALAGGAATTIHGAIVVSGALACGQTLGKAALLLGVRSGSKAAARHKVAQAVERTAAVRRAEVRQSGEGTPWRQLSWRERTGRLYAVMMRSLEHRWQGPAVIFVSGSVGIPPLLLTAVAAGLSQMRLLPFVLACFAGRWIRLLVIAVPAAWAF